MYFFHFFSNKLGHPAKIPCTRVHVGSGNLNTPRRTETAQRHQLQTVTNAFHKCHIQIVCALLRGCDVDTRLASAAALGVDQAVLAVGLAGLGAPRRLALGGGGGRGSTLGLFVRATHDYKQDVIHTADTDAAMRRRRRSKISRK